MHNEDLILKLLTSVFNLIFIVFIDLIISDQVLYNNPASNESISLN